MTIIGEEFYKEFVSRNMGIFSDDQQEKLRNAHVAIIGVGGIGSPVVEMLARTGIENLTICDKDTFEISNMNRQTFAYTDSVGERKIDATEYYVKKMNPAINIRKFDHVGEDNIDEMLKGVDIVVNGADEVRACLVIYRKARALGIPAIEAFAVPYVNYLTMMPDSMPWETAYGLGTEDREPSSISDKEQLELEMHYLSRFDKLEGLRNFYDPSVVTMMLNTPEDFHFPNLAIWNFLSAPFIANQVLKILLDWGIIIKSPQMPIIDPYSYRMMVYNLATGEVKRV